MRGTSICRLAPCSPPPVDVGPWASIDLSGSMAEASKRILGEFERRKLELALKEAGGNKGRASEMLQVPFKLMTAKLREYGLDS